MTSLRHLRSSTADKRPDPTAMVDGQLAMNYDIASPGLFFKDDNGTLIKVGPVHVGTTAPNVSPAAGGTAGNSIGEQWLDTTSGVYVLKVWDGSAWRSESGTFVDVSGDTMTGALTMANQQAVRFSETTANGSNYIALQATAAVASNKTITLPDTTGTVVTTGDTGTVTSTMIENGTILNADVNASAAIAGSKVSPDFGSQTVATTGIFSSATGTAAAPSIAFTGDLNTGIYSPGADQLAVSTGGTGRLFIDSSGLVGIGTSSPSARLDLGTPGETSTFFQSTNGTNSTLYFSFAPNVTQIGNAGGSAALAFATNATERLRVDSSGKVGIGTNNPGEKLHVLTSSNKDVRIADASHNTLTTGLSSAITFSRPSDGTGNFSALFGWNNGGIALAARNEIVFANGGDSTYSATIERLRIDSSGRLLVGTSSPRSSGTQVWSTQIEGVSPVNAPTIGLGLTRNQSDFYGPYLCFGKTRGTSNGATTIVANGDELGGMLFSGADGSTLNSTGASIIAAVDGTPGANDMPGRLIFSTTADGSASPTEAMRINNARELLIGYTADNGAYKLQVNSQIFATSATVATSDGRYKENVATLNGCIDLVSALRPVSFDWKPQQDITRIDDDGSSVLVREGHNFPNGKQVGFIAQEVQEVLANKPWLNSIIKQNVRPAIEDADGNELAPEEEFFGIAEGNLTAVLTAALQEAIARIETLEAAVAALSS